jgi:hypothetical protein
MNTSELRREMHAKGLENCTPVEIDTVLSEIYQTEADIQDRLMRASVKVTKLAVDLAKIRKGARLVEYRTALSGIELLESIEAAEREVAHQRSLLNQLAQTEAPYAAQYNRRRWSRYFLVQNDNGHVHSSMRCSTCNREGQTTRFGWMVEFSGRDERELTAEIGPNACTVCYPWAETIRIEHIAEVKRQKAADKAAAEAEKARIAAEKGITTPEGDQVYASRDNASWDVCKTLRTAEIAATDALLDLLLEKRTSVDPEYAWRYEMNGQSTEKIQIRIAAHAWCLIRSIAFKTGRSFQEVFEVHEKKAQAKLRKIDRDWAKDLRNPNRIK